MKLVLLTKPGWFEGEADIISTLFEAGLELLHLRKPGSEREALANFIEAIPSQYHGRIVLHDHHSLSATYQVGGLHLNSRNPERLPSFKGRYSCSCHSLAEAAKAKESFDYVFLSPVFDSISKPGYAARYAMQELEAARGKALIDSRVFALGGVDITKIRLLATLGFGGVALLGGFWDNYSKGETDTLLMCLADLLAECSQC